MSSHDRSLFGKVADPGTPAHREDKSSPLRPDGGSPLSGASIPACPATTRSVVYYDYCDFLQNIAYPPRPAICEYVAPDDRAAQNPGRRELPAGPITSRL